MAHKWLKYGFILGLVIALSAGLSGCYTQLSKGGHYAYYEDEQEPVYEEEQPYIEQEEYTDADTIVIHKSDRYDVYVNDWYPNVYIDAWWYQPYWYYSSSYWWRHHHHWDPWWGFSFSWGDPWYWRPFTYYGGWAFYDPFYSGWGWGHGYYDPWYWGGHHNHHYYDDGPAFQPRQRPFAFGKAPGVRAIDTDQRSGQGGQPAITRTSGGREVVPRTSTGTGQRSVSRRDNPVDNWYNQDTRREQVDRTATDNTVVRPANRSGSSENAGSSDAQRQSTTRRSNTTRRSGTPATTRPDTRSTPVRPQRTPEVTPPADSGSKPAPQVERKKESAPRETPTRSRSSNSSSSRKSSSSVKSSGSQSGSSSGSSS